MRCYLALFLCVTLIFRLQAYTICSGVLDSPKVIKGPIKVVGSCTIRNIVVKGSVENKDGKLATEGEVLISGNVFSGGQGTALGGKTVIKGKFTTGGTATHTFAKDVRLRVLFIAGLESINKLRGFAGKVLFKSASELRLLDQGKVGYGGIIATGISAPGNSQVRIGFGPIVEGLGLNFSAEPATVLGPVVVKNVERLNLVVFSVSFARNIVVRDSSGVISIGPTSRFGKTRQIIKNFKGVASFGEVRIPPTIIANLQGRVSLDGAFDKYFTVKDVVGEVLIGASGNGPFKLLRTRPPTDDPDRIQSVFLSEIEGPVLLKQNKQLELFINDNTGGVKLVGNEVISLKCANNNPAPVGFRNTFKVSPSGQCKNLN